MKQSTKLLSLVLALVMAFSMVSVIGNAALVKSEVRYDSIDNADLTAEQVADIVLDILDTDVLPGIDIIDAIVVKLDLRSVNSALTSIYNLLNNGTLNFLTLTIADVQALIDNRDLLKYNGHVVQRSDGDLQVIYSLLSFLSNNDVANVISKIVYGIGTSDGITLGLLNGIVSGAVGDVNDTVQNLANLVREPLFDALLHGSYSYPDDWETNVKANTNSNVTGNLDNMLNTALYNLLTTPQDYTWEGTDDAKTKNWDMNSIISKQFAALDANTAKGLINVNTNSLLQIVDNIIQIAYNEFGDVVLNNDVKKLLMEATGADFTQIKDADLIARITSAPDYIDPEGENAADVKNYLCNAQMWKYAGTWYFRDYVNVVQKDANGEALLDEDGNEIKQKENRYFVATTGGANDFFSLVNWDYHFTDSDFDFNGMISANGSIFGCLNTLVYKILKKCVNPATLDVDSIWTDGGNDNVNENLVKAAKWVITTYTRPIFGRDSEYVGADGNATQAFIDKVNAQTTLLDLVALIGLPFMNDAMPQLVMPKDANGDFAFTSGVQVLQLGALVIREFVTDIAPNVNYDDQIFAAGSLTAASGRQFASHTAAQWIDIILSMGIDLGITYLDNITNFNMNVAEANEKGWDWHAKFEEVVDWAVEYIGDGSSSPIVGLDPTTLGTARGTYSGDENYAFNVLSKALNTLLPLGLVSNCSSDTYALDVSVLFERLKTIVTDLDIETLLSFFGRTGRSDNILSAGNLVGQVLGVAKKLIDCILGSGTLTVGSNLENTVANANLKVVIKALLTNLNSRKVALLTTILPVLAQFISDWGGEQKMGTPKLSLGNNVALTNGAVSGATFTAANGSVGVWRHGYMQDGTEYTDNQYKYAILSAAVKDIEGNPVSGISFTTSFGDTGINLDFGQSTTLTYNVSGIPAEGKVVRFDVNYQVFNEDGATMANGKVFTTSKYVYLSYNGNNTETNTKSNNYLGKTVEASMPKYIYVSDNALSSIANQQYLKHVNKATTASNSGMITPKGTATQNGITLNKVSTESKTDATMYAAPFSFNEANFTPLGHEGATYTWQYTLTARGSESGTQSSLMYVINSADKSELDNIVKVETGRERIASDYNTGICYASKLLNNSATTDALKQETNFNTTGEKDGEIVTIIDGATAWSNYVTAFNNAVRAAYQLNYNGSYVMDFYARCEALTVAAADLDWCRKTVAQLAAEGGENNDTAVANIKADLATIATAMNGKSASDYKLYRWNRFTSARGDAQYLVNLQKQQSLAVADTQYFTYANISATELATLVNGNQYSAYILALLKDYTAEQQTANAKNLDNLKSNYANYAALDVEQIDNLLNRTYTRLLTRDGGLVTHYINDEIASAVAMFGEAATSTTYTERSWNRYIATLADARTAALGNSQDKMFDAKYELQVARNELVKVEDEADYSELEALIADATNVLANPSYYDNSNADFGGVLAALGMDALTDADGNKITLFPNAATVVNTRGYDEGDQRKIDNAANALKVALSVMKFKAAAVTPVAPPQGGTGAVIENNVVLEEATENTPAVVASVATIAAKQVADAVKSLVTASATGAGAVTAVVSSDNNYTVNDGTGFVGTGATVTFYTEVNSIKVPVATVKIVVKGDVNGDGVIDALDAMVVELVSTLNSSVSGCFAKAADFDASGLVDAADFGSVVNTAIAG